MIAKFIGHHEAVLKLFQQVNMDCVDLLLALQEGRVSEPELADLGYTLHQTEKFLEDLRKEITAKKAVVSKLISMRVMEQSVQRPGADLNIRGKFATASPDVKMRTAVPTRGTPEYFELCRHFEIPLDVAQSGCVSFSFTQLSELVTKLTSEGKDLPPGLTKKFPEYTCVYRKHK